MLLLAAIGSVALQACGSNQSSTTEEGGAATSGQVSASAGPQPLLDSTYIIKTLRAEPRFKPLLPTARRFYRERQFKLAWFKGHQPVPAVL